MSYKCQIMMKFSILSHDENVEELRQQQRENE